MRTPVKPTLCTEMCFYRINVNFLIHGINIHVLVAHSNRFLEAVLISPKSPRLCLEHKSGKNCLFHLKNNAILRRVKDHILHRRVTCNVMPFLCAKKKAVSTC